MHGPVGSATKADVVFHLDRLDRACDDGPSATATWLSGGPTFVSAKFSDLFAVAEIPDLDDIILSSSNQRAIRLREIQRGYRRTMVGQRLYKGQYRGWRPWARHIP